MSEDQNDANEGDPKPEESRDEGSTEASDAGDAPRGAMTWQFDPAETPAAEVQATAEPAEAVEYDDRDIRVPRADDDQLAEPSIEEQVRSMATAEYGAEPEPPQEATPLPTDHEVTVAMGAETTTRSSEPMLLVSESDPDNPEVKQAQEEDLDEAGDNPEERQMKAEAADDQKTAPQRAVPRPAMADAHEAFRSAVRAHSRAKGLTLLDQSAFLQIKHEQTGHKVYVNLAVKTREARVETTLPVIGRIPGAVEHEKGNGRIAAVMNPSVDDGEELKLVLSLIDILASGEYGKLPPPKRKEAPAKQA